ncbi:response regulator [Phenylobacterium ferrooxidans]|uniref:Response regulator n=1 Tax=Phenylobacterium ferrooxidans TaxID=2982689 RepID=A0ABW6CTT1_9CAUL
MSNSLPAFIDDAAVLFVDDNAICGLETSGILRDLGYQVLSLFDAAGAFAALARRQPLIALVTDVDLGPGSDGFDIARAARRVYPALPVVYISGTASARHVAEGVPGSEFVAKPCNPADVAGALARALGRIEA